MDPAAGAVWKDFSALRQESREDNFAVNQAKSVQVPAAPGPGVGPRVGPGLQPVSKQKASSPGVSPSLNFYQPEARAHKQTGLEAALLFADTPGGPIQVRSCVRPLASP